MDGRRRAAALLIALGDDVSAEILRRLPEEDVGRLTWEIVGIGQLAPEQREEVLSTFYASALGRDFVSIGGVEYAQTMLRKAFGAERASELVGQLEQNSRSSPFSFLRQVEPRDLLNFLQGEHPQVVSLILAYLPTDPGSTILGGLPDEIQAEVAVRMAIMERTSPDVIVEIEDAMRARLGSIFSPRQAQLEATGGIEAVVELLRKVDLATEKAILEGLESTDPDTANEIKKRMFVFENVTLLDDRSIQRVLREVDGKDLGTALKGATEEVSNRVLSNMSERASKMLEDDMAAMGPVRLRQVEETQDRSSRSSSASRRRRRSSSCARARTTSLSEPAFVPYPRGGRPSSRRSVLRSAPRGREVTVQLDGELLAGEELSTGPEALEQMDAAADIVEEARRRSEELLRGYTEGLAAARGELAQALALVQAAAREGQGVRDEIVRGAEADIVGLALAALEVMVGVRAEHDRELVAETVRRALERLGARRWSTSTCIRKTSSTCGRGSASRAHPRRRGRCAATAASPSAAA